MTKLIDADKLLEWIENSSDGDGFWEGGLKFAREAFDNLTDAINSGAFDPTPPAQPDIKPGDKVRHLVYKKYGIGEVKEIARSGKQVYVEWPNFDEMKCDYAPTPAYYRLDKLEVIK